MAGDKAKQGADREIWLAKWPSDIKEDDLLPWKLTGHAELGKPFRYELLMLSKLSGVKPASVVGHDITVLLDVLGSEEGRYFNGYVSSFENAGMAGTLHLYRAVLRPWTWLLAKRTNCRVFQDKSAIEILKAICGEDRYKGFSLDFDESGLPADACRKRAYCVQFRESDFDFISRLLEEEGIYYYYVHEQETHKMILCSAPADHGPYLGQPSDPADPLYYAREGNNVESWTAREEIRPEVFRHRDYDFQNPGTFLENQAADFDVYEYPARCAEPVFDAKDGGKHAAGLAKIRSEELKALATVVEAETVAARWLVTGHKFKMEDHPDAAQNREYLVLSSHLEFEGDDFGAQTKSPGEQPAGYRGGFRAIPADTQFRPTRATPRPRIAGLQTATVVGSDGSTADRGKLVADKVGRVWLRFHWDLESNDKEAGGKGEYHYCPVRVAQPWAGCGFGALFMPRVGDEVVVSFIDGDPDRPLVVGSVYNGVNAYPYDPAQMATVSAIQTRSIDTTDGFNEVRFDDKKGEELLFMQAQKDLEVQVKNDRRETVANNRHLIVTKDKFEHVEHNRSEKVDADHMEQIGKDRHVKVTGKEAKEVGKSLSLTVKGDVIEVFKGDHGEATTKDYYLKAKNVVIEATANITLCVGGSHIAIEPGGIEIHSGAPVKMDGAQIEVKGTGPVKIEGAQIDVKGSAMASIDGGGMAQIKGGIVKIN
ncbi:MAG: type VI secretion system Vgr family protein [Planctomycetota bacterium]|jgi:type VI secretion system secreted protein VgrG